MGDRAVRVLCGEMGLTANGEYGVKALIKSKYRASARSYASLGDVRKATGSERSQVVAALDGNVLMMQVPRSAGSFAAYIGIVTNAIRQAMGSAQVVVVVFDDPAYLTAAKREEQAKRDANRKKVEPLCSDDLFPYPTTDNYGIAELTSTSNCHSIVGCRPARQRFFDETGRQVLDNLKKSISTWAQHEDAQSVVIFDGLDPRGANRPIGAPREARIYGSDPEWAALFQRDEPIGEGDLKLAFVEERVRQLTAQGKLPTRLHMTITIDTDSIAIELMEQARRNCLPPPEHTLMGVLCMRERAPKIDDSDDSAATFWALDYSELLDNIQMDMWRVKRSELLPTAVEQRAAMSLMAAGWALSGSDFCKISGMRADMVFDAMPSLVKTAPDLLARMHKSWSGNRDETKHVTDALRRLVLLCAGAYADQPRARKATAAAMRDHDATTLLRGAWTVSYWNGHEHTGDLTDFGFTAIYDDALVQPLNDKKSVKRKSPEVVEVVDNAALPSEEPRAAQVVLSRYFASNARE